MTSRSLQPTPSAALQPAGPVQGHRSRRGRLWRRLLLSGAAFAAVIVLAEGAVRLLVPRDRFLTWQQLDYYEQTARGAEGRLQVDLELGHVPVIGGVDYDEQAILRSSRQRVGREPRTLFLGDSVTRRGPWLAALRELAPGGTHWNAGVEAWGPVQEVEFYFRHNRRARPQRVVLTFHNNDFSITPIALWGDGGLAICTPGEAGAFWPTPYRYCWLYRLWVNSQHPRLMSLPGPEQLLLEIEASMLRLRDSVQQDGVELQVLLLPPLPPRADWRPEEIGSRRLAIDMLERLGLRWIDLIEPIRQMHEAGVVVEAVRGDRWHPNADASHALAFHALQKGLFAEWSGKLRTDIYAFAGGSGGAQLLQLDAGQEHAGMRYCVVGSASGFGDGIELNGASLPIRSDAYMAKTLWEAASVMEHGAGQLDAHGRASITVSGPDMSSATEPARLYHVAVVYDESERVVLVSNVVPLFVSAP